MIKTSFFDYLLPQVLSTTVLIASIAIYSQDEMDRLLLLCGVLGAVLIHVLMVVTMSTVFAPTVVHVILSTLVVVLSTVIGYNMTKNKRDILYRLSIVLLPVCLISSQSVDICLYLVHSQPETMTMLLTYAAIGLCSVLIGMIFYYASLNYVSFSVQKCSYSFVIYLTGALFASKVCDGLDTLFHPTIKNIVTIMREAHLQQTANTSQMVVVGTGYSVYWFMISFCLIYDLKK